MKNGTENGIENPKFSGAIFRCDFGCKILKPVAPSIVNLHHHGKKQGGVLRKCNGQTGFQVVKRKKNLAILP